MSQVKTAQKRKILDKTREFLDLGTKSLEFFDSEFKEFMSLLRSIDDATRTKAGTLKDSIKRAQVGYSAKDYVAATYELSRFYDTVDDIMKMFQQLNYKLETSHLKILVDDLDPDVKSYLRDRAKRASKNDEIVKLAFFESFINKFMTKRRMVSALEKRFGRYQELRNGVKQNTAVGSRLLSDLLTYFDQLSKARAKGDINSYERIIKAMTFAVTKSLNGFNIFFRTTVKPFIDYLEANTSIKQFERNEEADKKSIDETHNFFNKNINPNELAESFSKKTTSPMANTTTPLKENDESNNFTKKLDEFSSKLDKKVDDESAEKAASRHNRFIEKLATLDDLDTVVSSILRYSKYLEDKDQEASLKLLAIAEGLTE